MSLPKHVGIILDGNRRWAKQHGLKTLKGHEKGAEQFIDITNYAYELGIEFVTAFIFSTENWQRAQEEVSYLMSLFVKILDIQLKAFQEKQARLVVLGNYDGVDPKVRRIFEKAEAETANNKRGTICLCFNYGGRQEIIDAIHKFSGAANNPGSLTADNFNQYLYGGPQIPDVDFIIRTSGEQRLSGFMLWRAAYAELYFSEKLWPDFGRPDFDAALAEFAARQRRFGK